MKNWIEAMKMTMILILYYTMLNLIYDISKPLFFFTHIVTVIIYIYLLKNKEGEKR